MGEDTGERDRCWWRGGVIYQIYPRSFQDSQGNGFGDLAGVTRRLDYVRRLGVDAIWLSPFFVSPMKDFGYDVADYCDVDPLFGDLGDFDALVDRAHSLGLKVMIDQVWSHSSDRHPWFEESRQNATGPKADWYVWADAKPDGTAPNNWLSVFGGPAWTWDSRRNQYYLHNFLTEQPDLNFHNPEVQDAILAVASFWLDRGVDGFRLDVCNFYFHHQSLNDNPPRQFADGEPRGPNPHEWQQHIYCRSQPENLVFLSRLRQLTDGYGDICLMGEIGDDEGIRRLVEYTEGNHRLHTAYSYELLQPHCDAGYIRGAMERWISEGRGWPTWALGNHDFPRLATRWTQGCPSPEQLRLFAAFHLSLRGTICLYQGEELGLEQADVPYERIQDPEGKAFWPGKPGRDGCRTPMPWESDIRLCGFSDAEESWLPVSEAHARRAVDLQEAEGESLLQFYRAMARYRSGSPALREGAIELLDPSDQVLAFTRNHGHQRWLCLFNFSGKPAAWTINAPGATRIVDSESPLSRLSAQARDGSQEESQVQLGPWAWAFFDLSPADGGVRP
ncbi:MAG: alpha-glucosidase family protein [Pseudomonadota bacterium]